MALGPTLKAEHVGYVPLLDRLAGRSTTNTTDLNGLCRSVERELHVLLNTRCPVPQEELARRPVRTVLEYGLPDLSNHFTTDELDHDALAVSARDAITIYEPRLADVHVKVVSFDRLSQTLALSVSGNLRLESLVEPITVEIPIGGNFGTNSSDTNAH